MKKEFMVERQGKTFVLYAGLLAMAHEQGLRTIRTDLVQVPSDANYRTAICTAHITLEQDGVERVFTGIGDAAPNNVAPAMQTCLIRMAETRAKARALRDAVNVGVTAFEELGEEQATDSAPERGYRSQRQTRQPSTPKAGLDVNAPITDAQSEAIRNMCRRRGQDAEDEATTRYNVGLRDLTQAQAGEMIRVLGTPAKAA